MHAIIPALAVVFVTYALVLVPQIHWLFRFSTARFNALSRADQFLLILCAASAITCLSLLVSASAFVAQHNQTSAAWGCLLASMLIVMICSTLFLNFAVLAPARHLWTTVIWTVKCGSIIYYSSLILQVTVALIGVITTAQYRSFMPPVELLVQRPLLCVWTVPFPAYLGHALLVSHAVSKIREETEYIDKLRIRSCVKVSGAILFTSAILLVWALISSKLWLHLVYYFIQCVGCVVLLYEIKLWKTLKLKHAEARHAEAVEAETLWSPTPSEHINSPEHITN